jgi:hypothetical protein
MKDAIFNWTKLFLENWKVVAGILALLGSLAGNGVLAVSNNEKTEKLVNTEKAVKIYADVAAKQWKEKQPVIEKQTIIKQDKSFCIKLLRDHVRKDH